MIIVNDNVISLKTNKTKRMSDAMDADINATVSIDVFYEAIMHYSPNPAGLGLVKIAEVGDVIILNNVIGILVKLRSLPLVQDNWEKGFVFITTDVSFLYPSFFIKSSEKFSYKMLVAIFQHDSGSCRWRGGMDINKKQSRELKEYMETE